MVQSSDKRWWGPGTAEAGGGCRSRETVFTMSTNEPRGRVRPKLPMDLPAICRSCYSVALLFEPVSILHWIRLVSSGRRNVP